jgi:hypothetical protein
MKKVIIALFAVTILVFQSCGFKTCPTYAKYDIEIQEGTDKEIEG